MKKQITGAQWTDIFKATKKRTASSPSAHHMGHYKVALKREELVGLHSEMTSLPFAFGFAPSRWMHLIDMMLKKDPGSPLLHRLQIIVVLEADMNARLKILSNHRLIPHTEKAKLIPREHFGNRKGVQALHCDRTKVLSLDALRINRDIGAAKMKDAARCYDCIIPASSSIVNQREGMQKSVTRTNCEVMKGMRRHIRTAHGVSENRYGDSANCQQYGEGQGKGSSSPTWLLISALLLCTLCRYTPGCVFECERWMLRTQAIAWAYVDDTDLVVTFAFEHLGEGGGCRKVVELIERVSQVWEQLLFASSGALAFKKCFWWLISWVWTAGRARPAKIIESPGEISLTEGRGTTKTVVERKEMTMCLKTLGV